MRNILDVPMADADGVQAPFPGASVMSLPPELLIDVFRYIHAPLRDERENSQNMDKHDATTDIQVVNERLSSVNTFPYPYIDVCKYWASIILSVPEFWTNAVVFVGRGKVYGKFAGGANVIFKASKNLPIDVTIRGINGDNSFEKDGNGALTIDTLKHEKSDIINILGSLSPHLHRCRSLNIFTMLSHAAPLVYRHLHGTAPLLKALTIGTDNNCIWRESFAGGGGGGLWLGLPPDNSIIRSTFAAPLEQLVLDGYSFQALIRYHADLGTQIHAGVVSLAVVGYVKYYDEYSDDEIIDPDAADNFLLASDAMRAVREMPALAVFKLTRVQFEPETPPDPIIVEVPKLVLNDMPEDSLNILFRCAWFTQLEELYFENCWPADDDDHVPITVPMLSLKNVTVPVSPVLAYWLGQTLRCTTSSGFNDDVLEMMSLPVDEELPEEQINAMTEFNCPGLRALVIVSCTSFTILALKRLIERRNRWIDYNNPNWRMNIAGPAIVALLMWESTPHLQITKDDEEWFHAHVPRFYYHLISK